ncbi:MAG: helix-turn-helix transcriptional regulator [Clostridia bacterium]|nr:helix-turn-helix transcriptional regulator [Clostridia bacterium]
MEYVSKKLNREISVTGIVNLHFFDFDNDFTTEDERHPFYELVFVNSGKLHIASEDYTGVLQKDQVIIHRQNTVHSLRCSADEQPTVIIIGFECSSDVIDRFSAAPLTLEPAAVRKLAEIVKEGRNVFAPPYNIPTYNMKKKKHQPYGSEQMLELLLEYFLIGLVREQGYSEHANEVEEASTAIGEIIHYVDVNYLQKTTIEELAFLFRTNRATLCREFKKATGKTLVEYINDKKLEKAKKKIIETQDSFTGIAEALNFESIHYFTRFFKKMSGQTPSEFRREHRTDNDYEKR